MASKRDYYDVLGISKTATEDEIKKAYRTKAKKYHPDVSKETNAEAKFKEVQEAYDVVGDKTKKAQYDQFGHAGMNQQQGFGGGGFSQGFGGFSDIFEGIFGGGGSRSSSRNSNRPRRGADVEKALTISFEEAVFGTKKRVKLNVDKECTACGGTGAYSKKDIHTCDKCHGSGYVVMQQRTVFGMAQTQAVCPKCGGKGQEITRKCESCGGAGRINKVVSVDMTIPAGVDNGISLRREGYGEAGFNGGPTGDLYVQIRVKPHNVFERNGDDIIVEIPITYSQAALGDSIQVPTPHGDVMLKIPAGTQSGTKFRLRDKGVPNVRTGRKGNQTVIANIVTPKSLSKEETALFKNLKNIEGSKKNTPWDKFKSLFK